MIRRYAAAKVCYTTTLTGGEAFCIAIRQGIGDQVTSLQQLHSALAQGNSPMPNPMTVKGAESLREELAYRKGTLRQEIAEAIAEARAHGDLKKMRNITRRATAEF